MANTQSNKTINIPILLPKMGESVSEATIIEWYKKPGETIEIDELFVLIGTDKVESELPSMYSGVLKEILVRDKEEIAVGEPICILTVDADKVKNIDSITHVTKETHDIKEDESVLKSKKFKDSKRFLSPVVRKMATEHGLELSDLNKINGTGENGRVRKKDILLYLDKLHAKPSSNIRDGFSKMDLAIASNDTVESLTRMQQLLADHLQQSFIEIPHVTTFSEIDITAIYNHREEIKESFLLEQKSKITYTHYIQYAVIDALKKFPRMNAWMNVDEIILKGQINLGFATSLDNGDLIVPNVKNAEEMNFLTWIQSVNQKAKEAKNHQLKNDDVQGTTFTISNTGMFGSLAGTPIVSKPQVAVLALGQILSAPGVIIENGVEVLAVRKKMMLSISYDHRVINGAYASLFLSQIKDNLKEFKNWF